MAASRKSRRSTKRSVRKGRKGRKGSRRAQRGGGAISCTLDSANKVQVTPVEGFTFDNSVANTLKITSTAPINDISFSGPAGNIASSKVGTGVSINIMQGNTALIPVQSFLSTRTLMGTQKLLNNTQPVAANTQVTITNLNTSNLGLSAANRAFTITIT